MSSHTGTCVHHPLTGRSGELAGQGCDLPEGTSLWRRKDRSQWFGPFLNLVPEKKIAQISMPLVKHCPLFLSPVLIVLSISLLYIYHTLVILEWVAISFSRDLPDPGIQPRSPAFQADALTSEPPGKPCNTS